MEKMMKIIDRRDFLKTMGLGAASLALPKGLFAAGMDVDRTNILWIMMDDCRADALGCYGRPWPRTPNMDAIAARGVRFETAIVQNPVCVPSRQSMKSGLYPHTLGVMAMGKPPSVPPAYLREAKRPAPNLLNSWKRIRINPVNIGKRHAYKEDWDHRGDIYPFFDVYGQPRNADVKLRLAKGGQTTCYPRVITRTHKWAIGGTVPLEPEEMSTWKLGGLALDTLVELAASGEPFFLRVSFHAPHVPCRVPASYMIDPDKIALPLPAEEELKNKPRFERENLRVYAGGLDLTEEQIRIARGTYYGMVSLVDAQVGRIVKVLKNTGLMDRTIIAINSDQGFQLGEHGLWKKRCFYEQNVCVPLIVSCPELLPSGRVIGEPVEMVDFLPTLMDLCGLAVPDSIGGQSLVPLVRGEVRKWKPVCFSEIDHSSSMYKELRSGTGRRVMVRTREWKLIYFRDERVTDKGGALYHLKNDPEEKENLYGKTEYRHIIKYLEGLAENWDETSEGKGYH